MKIDIRETLKKYESKRICSSCKKDFYNKFYKFDRELKKESFNIYCEKCFIEKMIEYGIHNFILKKEKII